ncbi:MAG TPA: GNAT family protein [Candidatus Nanopelagicales bacterium]|nr:GNAT family protein [Candidatus Nanopelagicales bacterium]
MPVPELRTDRLLLRPWTTSDADAEACYAVLSHPDVWPWLGADPKPCPDVEAARRTCEKGSSFADGAVGLWAVETPEVDGISPQPCGTVLVVPLPRSDGAPSDVLEIGWHLHPHAWGRGIATEAALSLVHLAREHGVQQLHAVVYEGNERSMAVCDRLGMTRLGPTDEWYGTTFVDHVLEL